MTCELCQAVLNTGSDPKAWNRDYIVIECRTCHVPMVVLREHRQITSMERLAIDTRFGGKYKIRWEMRSIKDHGHCHLEAKG